LESLFDITEFSIGASSPALVAILVATMVFAGLVHGTLGLGFPMVATPIVAAMLDVKAAILLTLLPTVAVNIASIIGGRGYVESVRRFWPLAVFGFGGAIAGTVVLTLVDPAPFKLLLAGLILTFLWTSGTEKLPVAFITRHAMAAMIVIGFGAGFAGGTTNVMVAVLMIYFLAMDVPRPTMVPVMNTCFMLGKLSQIGVLLVAGLLTTSLLLQTAPLAGVAIVAVVIGQRLRERVPVALYRQVLLVLLAILALVLIVQFIGDM
jgi:uncharacterized protein